MDSFVIISSAVLLAYIADFLLGDPMIFSHPIIWFGKVISFFEKNFNKGKNRKVKGAIIGLFLQSSVFIIFLTIDYFLKQWSIWAEASFVFIFTFYGLANRTLIQEGKMVFEALDESLEKGRTQVGRIVGRDTLNLSPQQIKTATLETLSENLSDGIVAPLFYLGIFGVPGIMCYKMINTLDSMIGYKSDRYKDFGFWSAKVDDVANFIPARLTAIMIAIASFSRKSIIFIFRYGNKHDSPNAGYPESALAGALDVRFGGENTYFGKILSKPHIGSNPRDLTKKDLRKTVRINHFVCIFAVGLTILLLKWGMT